MHSVTSQRNCVSCETASRDRRQAWVRHSQRAPPQVPGDPKVLVSAMNPAALAAFHLTSLEAGGRWELPGEADLGAPLTVLDVAAYAAPASAQPLHPDDEALLEV